MITQISLCRCAHATVTAGILNALIYRYFVKRSRRIDLAMCWTVLGSNPGRSQSFSLLQNVQAGSGANPPYYSLGAFVISWD